MKKFVSLFLVLLMCGSIFLSSACSADSAEGEEEEDDVSGYQGEVNVYNWGEYISPGDDDTLDVIDEFQKKYHIKVKTYIVPDFLSKASKLCTRL